VHHGKGSIIVHCTFLEGCLKAQIPGQDEKTTIENCTELCFSLVLNEGWSEESTKTEVKGYYWNSFWQWRTVKDRKQPHGRPGKCPLKHHAK